MVIASPLVQVSDGSGILTGSMRKGFLCEFLMKREVIHSNKKHHRQDIAA